MSNLDTKVNEELGHFYVDCDGIRLVYECVGGVSFPKLVGWYRPDAWGKPAPVENGYAVMARVLDYIGVGWQPQETLF